VTDRAGWYADPSGRPATYRWWDGSVWTRWLTADPNGPGPELADVVAPEPEPRRDGIAVPWAIGLIVAGLVLALVVVGAVIALDSDRMPSGTAVAPPPRNPKPVVALLDRQFGQYVAGPVRVKLAGAPFDCFGKTSIPASADPGYLCWLGIHEQYKKGWSWYARITFGVLSEGQVVPGDLRATTDNVLDRLIADGFKGVRVDPRLTAGPRPDLVVAPDEAMMLSGSVGYRVPNLPSTSSAVTIIVIRHAASGKHVVLCADRPNDLSQAGVAAMEAMITSLTAR